MFTVLAGEIPVAGSVIGAVHVQGLDDVAVSQLLEGLALAGGEGDVAGGRIQQERGLGVRAGGKLSAGGVPLGCRFCGVGMFIMCAARVPNGAGTDIKPLWQ